MIPRLKEKYESLIVSSLQKKLEFGNKLMVPKLTKIVVTTTTTHILEAITRARAPISNRSTELFVAIAKHP